MKKFILGLTVAAVFFTSGCSKNDDLTALEKIHKNDKLVVGINFEAKPFGFVENGAVKGFDADLAKIIAKNILGDESKVEYKQITPSNRILALNSEDVDIIISAMSITQQRQGVVRFSTPYFVAGQVVLIPRSSKISSMGELNNKRIIVILGSTGEKNLRYYAPNAFIQGYRSYYDAFSALKNRKADAMVGDDAILMNFAKSDKNFKVLPRRYTKEPYAVAYRKTEESESLGKEIDRIIAGMQEKGLLNQLKAKWEL